jgi:hypothetical protein
MSKDGACAERRASFVAEIVLFRIYYTDTDAILEYSFMEINETLAL